MARYRVKLETDDAIREVNNIFLGGKGWTTPWEARFVAYAIAGTLMLWAILVERRLGISTSFWSVVWTLMAVVQATRSIGQHITFEVPLRALLSIFRCEVTAPRRQTRGQRIVLRPGKVTRSCG
jgi:hypothetical protein